jgi:hypothetical protein
VTPSGPLRFENRRLRQMLGWTPPLDYEKCLEVELPPGGAHRSRARRRRLFGPLEQPF